MFSDMIIEKSGIYVLNSDKDTDDIKIISGIDVKIFDLNFGQKINRKLYIGENTTFLYNFLSYGKSSFDINIFPSSGTIGNVSLLLLSKGMDDIIGKIDNVIDGNNIKDDIDIVGLIGDDGNINVDGNISVESGSKGINAKLDKCSLFLGESGKSNLMPKLHINSNDVSIGHGAKIDRLDKNKMLYMMSKGISETDSRKLMVSGIINNFFDGYDGSDEFKSIIMDYIINT